jgi:2-oxoisovalerate dehydrogenase E1 component alpha subunit
LSREALLDMYWQMLRSRRLDERAWVLHRQGKIAYHISAIGHEAAQVGAAFALEKGRDYVAPYYRDLALMLALGLTAREFCLMLMGKGSGRAMPGEWSLRRANVISVSSIVAAHAAHAAGLALASQLRGEDRVTLVSLGEGATAQGEWYEALNWAAIHKLPLVCFVQNNLYALSTPASKQMAVANVADKAAALGLPGVVVDGNDVLAVHRAVKDAVERARNRGGPTLVEAKTYRVTPHSSDDDDRTYRTLSEVAQWKKRDPVVQFRSYLEMSGLLTAAQHDDYDKRAEEEVRDAVEFAEEAPPAEAAEAARWVYAEKE